MKENSSIQYKTVLDELLIKFSQTEYVQSIRELTDFELTEIFHKLALCFENDFLEFYQKVLEFNVSYDSENDVIVFDPKNVLSATCMYRSVDDIFTFYDPDNDIYEDGFLRVYYDNDSDKPIIIDYLKEEEN